MSSLRRSHTERAFAPSLASDLELRPERRLAGLLDEIDGLIADDESGLGPVRGAWKTFADVDAAAQRQAWDAYSVDLSVDADSYRHLGRQQQEALLRVFGTIYRAEAVVDDWMNRIVAAIPAQVGPRGAADDNDYDAMRTVLEGQEHDEKMHRGSLVRVATEVLGIEPGDVERVAKKYDNFVAETLFARFDEELQRFLRPGRPLEDVFMAIFLYGIVAEDVVANGDVVLRRAKGRNRYDEYNLPGMKLGQTRVRRDEGRHVRIAVLATRKFLREHEDAPERLLSFSREYLDLADSLLRRAKRSHGLIDAHLRESYGPDVDALYYYVMNMKRFAVRLDELGLQAGVAEIKERVARAMAEFTDDLGRPIVEEPGFVFRRLGPHVL